MKQLWELTVNMRKYSFDHHPNETDLVLVFSYSFVDFMITVSSVGWA